MNLIGSMGFDLVVSYTRMSDPIAHSEVFSAFVLGDYLYKYDNHTQFNEYEDGLYMEFRYDNTLVKGICDRLGEMILKLDSINLDEQLSIGGQEASVGKGEVEGKNSETICSGKAQRSSTLQLLLSDITMKIIYWIRISLLSKLLRSSRMPTSTIKCNYLTMIFILPLQLKN